MAFTSLQNKGGAEEAAKAPLLLGSVSLVLRETLNLSLGALTKGRDQAACTQQGQRASQGPGTPGPGTISICRLRGLDT